jgi:hypothetical protein
VTKQWKTEKDIKPEKGNDDGLITKIRSSENEH